MVIKNKAEHFADLNEKLTAVISKCGSVINPEWNPIFSSSYYSEKFHDSEEPEYIEGVTSGKIMLDLSNVKYIAIKILSETGIKFTDKGNLQVPGTERPEKNPSGNLYIEVDLNQKGIESKIERANEIANAWVLVEKHKLLDKYPLEIETDGKPKTKEELRTLLTDMAERLGLEKPLFKGNGTEPSK